MFVSSPLTKPRGTRLAIVILELFSCRGLITSIMKAWQQRERESLLEWDVEIFEGISLGRGGSDLFPDRPMTTILSELLVAVVTVVGVIAVISVVSIVSIVPVIAIIAVPSAVVIIAIAIAVVVVVLILIVGGPVDSVVLVVIVLVAAAKAVEKADRSNALRELIAG